MIPFSIRYARNQPSPYSKYFVAPLGGEDEIYFRQQKLTPKTLLTTLSRLFFAEDVRKSIKLLARDTRPDIAYVLHYLRKLSPSLLVGLKQSGVPVIVRLSDYAMLCPQAHCLRDDRPCELCTQGNLLPSLQYHCVQNNLPASALNFAATQYHRAMRYFDLVDRFVVTTRFMYQKMQAAGYKENRLYHIPTFVNGETFHPDPEGRRQKYIAYVGRLEKIKGVHVLIDALGILKRKRPGIDIKLRVAGSGDQDYLALINQKINDWNLHGQVVLLGEQENAQIVSLLNKALVSIIPSICFENLPNVVLESYGCGTAVIASNLGSLPECVDEGQTGLLFKPGDAGHLAEQIAYCYDHPEQMNIMGEKARGAAVGKYSKQNHLNLLEALCQELRGGKIP